MTRHFVTIAVINNEEMISLFKDQDDDEMSLYNKLCDHEKCAALFYDL